jgi:hypothetical protein
MTKKYIGFKMIDAWEQEKEGKEGYAVKYPDGYISWSPKEVFENAYMQVGDNGKVEEHNVHDFVKDIEYMKWGEKTTIANATLANGFVITEASSCVDPVNYNQDIGESICRERIYNEVWKMLGFLLQTAKYGIK